MRLHVKDGSHLWGSMRNFADSGFVDFRGIVLQEYACCAQARPRRNRSARSILAPESEISPTLAEFGQERQSTRRAK